MRFTDYQGKTHDPKIYTNFLEALSYPGADTRVQLFEEGDYEVSLDYEIKQEGTLVDKYYNYKIAIEFKIRNGNKKVYPRDVSTGSYLANTSVTENGFVLDWARSRYLQVNVKYSRWTKGADGKYVEDVIFDQPAKETDAYKKTGVYTFTVKNPSTGETTDPTKIYVGSDSVLIAYVNPQNTKYTVEQISNMVDNEGYTISRNGELIPPVVTVSETTSSETIITTTETTTMSATTLNSSQSTVISSESLTEADAKEDETGAYNVIPWIGLGTVGLAGITVASFRMTRHRKSNENRKEEG